MSVFHCVVAADLTVKSFLDAKGVPCSPYPYVASKLIIPYGPFSILAAAYNPGRIAPFASPDAIARAAAAVPSNLFANA